MQRNANSAAGLVFLFFLWVWVVLPFLGTKDRPGGTQAVRRVLAAKFLNRTS